MIGVAPGLDFSGFLDYVLSTEEVYKKAAEAVVAHTRKLDIICESETRSDTHLLPSWASDWSTRQALDSVLDRSRILEPRTPSQWMTSAKTNPL